MLCCYNVDASSQKYSSETRERQTFKRERKYIIKIYKLIGEIER